MIIFIFSNRANDTIVGPERYLYGDEIFTAPSGVDCKYSLSEDEYLGEEGEDEE